MPAVQPLLGAVVRSDDQLTEDRSLEAHIKSRGTGNALPASSKGEVGNLPSLTGLRGLAALMVAYYHAGLGPHQDVEFPVLLFFLLSGFLMGHLYFEKEANSSNVLRYALARVGRVFPAYLFLVIGFEVIPTLWCSGGYFKCYTANEAFAMLTFWQVPKLSTGRLHHYGSIMYWTVPVEVQYYAVFALTWWFARTDSINGHLKRAIVAMIGLAYLGAAVKLFYGSTDTPRPEWLPFASTISAIHSLPDWFVYEIGICDGNRFCLPSYLPVFGAGSVLGVHWRATLSPMCRSVHPAIVEATAALSLFLAVVPLRELRAKYQLELRYPGTLLYDKEGSTTFSETFLDPASWAVAISLLLTSAHGARSLSPLRTEFFQYTGKISYGFYLLNMHVFDFVYAHVGTEDPFHKGLAAAVALAAVFLISSCSFFFYEAPLHAWVRSLHAREDHAALRLLAAYTMLLIGLCVAIKAKG
jgi:peptidoglycan/LPS O-acetylase OafA/YrhL